MVKLLNCPWCGGKPKIHRILFWCYVECNNWKCHMVPSTPVNTKEIVIEKWNTRAPVTQQRLSDIKTSDES